MKKDAVIEQTVAAHTAKFGTQPESAAWAPGRVEVLGNHTDYNKGTVLSIAIDLGVCFCISRSPRPEVCAQAVDVNRTVCFELTDAGKVPNAGWADYIKGVFYCLQKYLKHPVSGFDCTFSGSIPMGAGLSSSAALEVSAATAMLDRLNRTIDPKEIAMLCCKAEHQFAGTNCGLLDQFSAIFGREHGMIHSDFQSLAVSSVQLPEDIEFLVINPKAHHTLSDSPYNERRSCCEQAAGQLAELLPHPVKSLRDVSVEEFELYKNRIDPHSAKRAAHVIGEINRVETGINLLGKGAIAEFGELLFQSHQSSIENFENSCPELDIVVSAARDAGALGARLSGGGFGGCVIAMLHAADAKADGEKIKKFCQSRGIKPELIEVTPSAGAQLIPKIKWQSISSLTPVRI